MSDNSNSNKSTASTMATTVPRTTGTRDTQRREQAIPQINLPQGESEPKHQLSSPFMAAPSGKESLSPSQSLVTHDDTASKVIFPEAGERCIRYSVDTIRRQKYKDWFRDPTVEHGDPFGYQSAAPSSRTNSPTPPLCYYRKNGGNYEGALRRNLGISH